MAIGERSALWPWRNGRPPHLPMIDPVPQAFLLPGDPARVDHAADVLDGFRIVGQNREFRMGAGLFEGIPIGICSTGIGGPSTEIAVVELAALGVRTVIRTGGMGALADDLSLGDFLVVEEAVPNSPVAALYAEQGVARRATPQVADMLDSMRIEMNLPGRRGRCATADGYYRPQGRPLGPEGEGRPNLLDALAAAGADGVEMEAETMFAVGAAVGLRTGAVLAVHAHRRSDGWLEDYEATQRNLLRIGAAAAAKLISSKT